MTRAPEVHATSKSYGFVVHPSGLMVQVMPVVDEARELAEILAIAVAVRKEIAETRKALVEYRAAEATYRAANAKPNVFPVGSRLAFESARDEADAAADRLRAALLTAIAEGT